MTELGPAQAFGHRIEVWISRGPQAPAVSSNRAVVGGGSLDYRIQGTQRVKGSLWAQLNRARRGG
ncbi:hypothetical protein BDW67DRAFT_168207 [Aspergillus spinulosporus]